MLASPWALGAVVVATGLQMLALLVPSFTAALQISPLHARDWGYVIALAAIPAVLGQVWKVLRPQADHL